MLKIIHAADFHLDSPFASLGEEKALLRRREQRALLSALAEAAGDADLVLLAGDLLDSGVCHAETVEAMEDFLSAISCPVFIAPGNHDFYAPESPWQRMKPGENVHIFSTVRPEAVPLPDLGCTVYGAAFTGSRSGAMLRAFRAEGEGLRLMVLHGDVGGQGGYDSITEAEIAGSGLHYLALGHIHTGSGLRRSGDTFWAYPGCLMGRGFDETGEKGFLRVELSRAGCKAEFVPLPGRRYEILPVDVTGAAGPQEAVAAALPPDAAEHVFRVVLRGQWPEKIRTEALQAALAGRCFHLELRDETRLLTDIWENAGEDTLRGAFLRVLKKKYDAAPEEERAGITLAARYGLAALDYREDL